MVENKKSVLFFILFVLFAFSCKKGTVKQLTDKNGYAYEQVDNDPLDTRIYTLDNGLKVYLSKNTEKPRILSLIAVKAGSAYDPDDNTGLAHYLEHMMFKGTDDIGSINWEKEKVLLDQISDFYEAHKAAKDPEEKAYIYNKIDSLSQIAAKYAVPNEYEKFMQQIGAEQTNAYTSKERTVYINNIPGNELERWLKVEKERFSNLVLRMFHTELETVYEEFNMSQDNDYVKSYKALLENLFPSHPYGTHTTLGEAKHLKNPSMESIHHYWNTFYRPNNMAVCMSGDLNYDETIMMIDSTFGQLEQSDVPIIDHPEEKPIEKIVEKNVAGPDAEHLRFGYRFQGMNSEERKYVIIIDHILNNEYAGLIDINLVQKQKVLRAASYTNFWNDYGIHGFFGQPREGQTLGEVKDLLVHEIEKVKQGDFDDWLIDAVINDFRLNRLRLYESNKRAYAFADAFIHDIHWADIINFHDKLEKISKEDVMNFAKKHYNDNYVCVYKRHGKDTISVKMEKPQISRIPLNRDTSSAFYRQFKEIQVERLEPVFLDMKNDVKEEKLTENISLYQVDKKNSQLFRLLFLLDMGSDHDKKLPVAMRLLNYLGTDQYAPDELQKQFYRYGIGMGVQHNNDRCYITLNGLDENLDKALELLHHILSSVKPDQNIYDEFVNGIIKERADAKLNKDRIMWQGLFNYGKYGKNNSFTHILKEDELRSSDPSEFTGLIRNLPQYKHQYVYCGPRQKKAVKKAINRFRPDIPAGEDYPEPIVIHEKAYQKQKVFFVDYDMVQVMVMMMAKGQPFNPEILPEATLFSKYFGQGLSSIVFQEIRESKGLAYRAFADYATPSQPDRSHYVYAYLSTQTDKLGEASQAMLELMNNMPRAEIQFNGSRESVMRSIETNRPMNMQAFWKYYRLKKMGFSYDNNKDIYERMQTITIDEFQQFFNQNIKGHNYAFLVLGNKDMIDMNVLSGIGEIHEVSVEEIFGY
jgi:zinc protease